MFSVAIWHLWIRGGSKGLPSGELLHNYGEIHHFIAGKIHYKWPFSIAMLVHQRVSLFFGYPMLPENSSQKGFGF